MEENTNTQDPFVTAMQGTQTDASGQDTNTSTENSVSPEQEAYPVNPGAEKVVDTLAEIIKYLSIIAGILCMLIGFALIASKESGGGAMMLTGVITIFSGIISWAFLKLLVNISRNLFILNERVKKLEEKKNS